MKRWLSSGSRLETYVCTLAQQLLRGWALPFMPLTERRIEYYERLHGQHIYQKIKALRIKDTSKPTMSRNQDPL